jgi:hypothetical protein
VVGAWAGTDVRNRGGEDMRAETEAMVEEIKQSIELLRRHL